MPTELKSRSAVKSDQLFEFFADAACNLFLYIFKTTIKSNKKSLLSQSSQSYFLLQVFHKIYLRTSTTLHNEVRVTY